MIFRSPFTLTDLIPASYFRILYISILVSHEHEKCVIHFRVYSDSGDNLGPTLFARGHHLYNTSTD